MLCSERTSKASKACTAFANWPNTYNIPAKSTPDFPNSSHPPAPPFQTLSPSNPAYPNPNSWPGA
jgi:hypothetical protein